MPDRQAEIQGLEEGEKFTVQEVGTTTRRAMRPPGRSVTEEAREGVLAEGTISPDGQNVTKVTFTNVLRIGSVKLGKYILNGAAGSENDSFTFLLKFERWGGKPVASRFEDDGSLTAVIRDRDGKETPAKASWNEENRAIP